MIDILKILGGYALFITVAGSFMNLLIFFTSLKFKEDISFKIIGVSSISDAFSLYFWNLNHYLLTYFNIDLQNFNIYSCKIGILIQFTSLQFSAWSCVSYSINFFIIFFNIKEVY